MKSSELYYIFGITLWAMIAEAVPFLLIGSLVAALIHHHLPEKYIIWLKKKPVFGIFLASISGMVFPLCKCAIVPVTRSLRAKGLPASVAFTFMISVPLINPVVMFSTAYAFRGIPDIALGRFLPGWIAALLVGAILLFFDSKNESVMPTPERELLPATADSCCNCRTESGKEVKPGLIQRSIQKSAVIARHTAGEFLFMGRFFLLGAMVTSLAHTFLPVSFLMEVGKSSFLSVILMMLLAFFLSVCSEADAFIARGFTAWLPNHAILAFLILGPMMDLKNSLMLFGSFPKKEVIRLMLIIFAAVSLVVALA